MNTRQHRLNEHLILLVFNGKALWYCRRRPSIRVTYCVWFRSSVNFNHVDPEIFLLHELLRAWCALIRQIKWHWQNVRWQKVTSDLHNGRLTLLGISPVCVTVWRRSSCRFLKVMVHFEHENTWHKFEKGASSKLPLCNNNHQKWHIMVISIACMHIWNCPPLSHSPPLFC